MKRNIFITIRSLLIAMFVNMAISLPAADIIYRNSDSRRLTGTVSDVSRVEVVLNFSAKNKAPLHIPANDIREIKWNGEPPDLTLMRAAERKELLEKALEGYEKYFEEVDSSQKNLKIDLSYHIARVKAKLALEDKQNIDEAISLLENYRQKNQEHYSFYEGLVLLNKLYQKKGSSEKVSEISALIAQAPWQEFRETGIIDKGFALLKEGQIDQAMDIFDGIIRDYRTKKSNSISLQAELGMANCYMQKEDYSKAEEMIYSIIDQALPEEEQVLSKTFLLQGKMYSSMNMPRDALLSYLRIDLIFSQQPKAHEEALFHLAELWKQMGNDIKASEYSEKLKKEYPDSQWISKLQ